MNAKTILNRFLSTTLAVALLFSSPLLVNAKEGAGDYTYMYLVTEKKYICKFISDEYYNTFDYAYNDYGMVSESNRTCNGPVDEGELGKTAYEYSATGNLTKVTGPYFWFNYSSDDKGRIKKYDMDCAKVVGGYDGETRFVHKLKFKKGDRSIFNPRCQGVPLLSNGDKYIFDKKGRPKTVKKFKNFAGSSWSGKICYEYDKKGNIKRLKEDTIDGPSLVLDMKLTYKKNRLTKIKYSVSYNEINKVVFKYKKCRVPKKYVKKVKEQQWRISNFDDVHSFGIDQPWKY